MLRNLALLTLCLAILGRSTAQDNTGLSKDFNLYTSNAYAASTTTNIEMNPFTGQINPSIPLYQKTMTDLGLRVSLSFQGGGGIKVDDPGSSVGRGWVLNCGGSIVRTVRGVPDDYLNLMPIRLRSTATHNNRRCIPPITVSMSAQGWMAPQ